MKKPTKLEYHPSFEQIIYLVGDGNYLELLDNNTIEVEQFFGSISTEKENYRYAVNKWSIKQSLMHLIDTERSFAYRAFVCIRGDNKTILYGMDEELYALNVNVDNRTIEELLSEFKIVREASKRLFENITDEQSQFLGNTQNHKISARALGFLIIGHTKHHINVVKNKYLDKLSIVQK
jgi:DinB superfamily